MFFCYCSNFSCRVCPTTLKQNVIIVVFVGLVCFPSVAINDSIEVISENFLDNFAMPAFFLSQKSHGYCREYPYPELFALNFHTSLINIHVKERSDLHLQLFISVLYCFYNTLNNVQNS